MARIGKDPDAFIAFPAHRFDLTDFLQQRPHGQGVGSNPPHLGTARGDAFACAAQFVARVAGDLLMVGLADQVHRYSTAQAMFGGRTQRLPRCQGLYLGRGTGQFVELQHGMGQALTDQRQRLA
ncbi:hypothetical protein D9M69_604270 [compost metagenome]